ncbi:MAG: transketolase [Sphaerochaeta sp.]|uniref:transketolase n=1 Tax=Sphaerochaeta sp. TaxID=1972642 RepID=UPI003D0AECA4
MNDQELQQLQVIAKNIRRETIDEIGHLGVGHIGGALSVVDILTLLYFRLMEQIDPKNPGKEGRDKLVLSKGHAGPALYAVLAEKGYFPKEWLLTLNQGGTNLPSHCDMNRTPGIDFTTGSLGQGSSAAAGIALADKLKNSPAYTYLIIGDGESQEGQIWEMAMFAAQYKLNNIIAFTDYNKLQIDGSTYDIIDLGDIEQKWQGFGWFVQRVNGHDIQALEQAVLQAKTQKEQPSMIICDTIKAKGFAGAEGLASSHNMAYDSQVAKKIIQALMADEEGVRS